MNLVNEIKGVLSYLQEDSLSLTIAADRLCLHAKLQEEITFSVGEGREWKKYSNY